MMKNHHNKRNLSGWKHFAFGVILLGMILAGCRIAPQSIQENVTAAPAGTNTPAFATPSPTRTPTPERLPSQSQAARTPAGSDTPFPTTNTPSATIPPAFSFVVNADPANHAGPGEMDTPQYFRGMVESIAAIQDVAFMVTVGDTTPPWDTRWTIDQYLGADFLWFPVVGNHEVGPNDMEWLRSYNIDPNGDAPPNIVSWGPPGCEETTYSFDYFNTHFVMLNVYCDLNNDVRTDGAIVPLLYDWLQADFEKSSQDHILVFGHEPAFPMPDADAGIMRHVGDSLDQYPLTRDRFWELLKDYGVVAYFTGHTHSYSVVDIEGVWQVDVGHSMGARTQATRSTFLVIHVKGEQISYQTFRANNFTDVYELLHSGYLKP